jgi:ubiquitin carboxyl-terminal hydrolase 8
MSLEIKKRTEGLTGLANLGNTCFMNTTLQCLSHTYTFNNFLDKSENQKKIQKKPESLILMEWNKLRNMMWSEDCIISPGGFLGAVQKVAKIKEKMLFTGLAQNDLPEFLNFIIDCFHTSIMREVSMNINGNITTNKDKIAKECFTMMKNMYKKEYSEVLDIFYGIHVSNTKGIDKDILGSNPEPFLMLDLPIPEINESRQPTINDCFNVYTKDEKLEDSEQYINSDGKRVLSKQILFWKLPDILIVTLKRFNNSAVKDDTFVHFPLENLDLSKYVIGYDKESFKYDLYGICNHRGGVHGGHYYAYVKTPNDSWYEFNDSIVKKIDISKNVSSDAYCLFYRKKK